MSMLNVFHIAGSALTAQAARLNTTASNLANADSIAGADGRPYRSRQVVFQAADVQGPGSLGVRVARVVESAAPMRQQYDPGNPAADQKGYVTLPNVNIVEEMVNMISASRAYQANADLMVTARQLALRTLAIGQ
jgi:flagellar basal-body rod protein FlgC